jgi:hypothetical protein
MRIPEVSRLASSLIRAVEEATPQVPVSLGVFGGNKDSGLLERLHQEVETTDALYDRHEELFFGSHALSDEQTQLDIAQLTHDVVAHTTKKSVFHSFFRGVLLGLEVMQLAEGGKRMAHNPSFVMSDDPETMAKTVSVLSSERVFEDIFAARIRGDLSQLPVPRLTYPGHLMDTHYDFWQTRLYRGTSVLPTFKVQEKVERLFPQFPRKTRQFDAHSFIGRPDRGVARKLYTRQLAAFEASLSTGASTGAETADNLIPTFELLSRVCTAGSAQGYSIPDCFKIIRWPKVTETLRRVDEQGGSCPARYYVELVSDCETAQNLKILYGAVHEHVGAPLRFLQERDQTLYVYPSALNIAYALLAMAINH